MRTIEATIPEQLDRAIDRLVDGGWFKSRDDILQEAIRRFLESHQPELMERFIHEDVEWGLRGER